eukprot:4470903-Amphidinium_carterae.1
MANRATGGAETDGLLGKLVSFIMLTLPVFLMSGQGPQGFGAHESIRSSGDSTNANIAPTSRTMPFCTRTAITTQFCLTYGIVVFSLRRTVFNKKKHRHVPNSESSTTALIDGLLFNVSIVKRGNQKQAIRDLGLRKTLPGTDQQRVVIIAEFYHEVELLKRER